MGLFKTVAKVAAAPFTGGASLLPKKTLFGETRSESPLSARQQKIQDKAGEKLQLPAIRQAQGLFTGDPTALARSAVEREAGAVTSGAQDAIRRLRESIAQRGLGQSAVGLGAEAALNSRTAKQAGTIRASLPERIRALKLANIQGLLSTSGSIMGQPGVAPVTTTNSGLAPLLGAGFGAALGSQAGPGGIGAGTKIGSGFGRYSSGMFG